MKISSRITGPVNKVLSDLFSDDGFNCAVTVVQRGETHWDDELEQNVTDETQTAVTAIRSKHSQKTVEKSNVPGVQVGDSVYLIRVSDMTFMPGSNDVIVHGSQELAIKGTDDFMFVYSVTVAGG